MTRSVRPPAVAGTFYPADPAELRRQVERFLQAAKPVADHGAVGIPKALIAPHAGYVYSGPVAGSAYALLRPRAGQLRRVVLLGPAHRAFVRGLALPGAIALATPLGDVPVDAGAVEALAGLPQVVVSAAAHAAEHSLEVQLPFLQLVLGDFSVVPLAVGDASAEQVDEVLDRLWGGPETLVVVSSDLSHYLPYDVARELDRETGDRILALAGPLESDRACGAIPVSGLLLAARRRGLVPRLLDLRSSGDTAGPRDQVVGYGAFALDPPEPS